MSEWTPHSDGYINGTVGVFPFLFGSWEVWVKEGGEWQAHKPLQPFKTMDEAKAAAEALGKSRGVPAS